MKNAKMGKEMSSNFYTGKGYLRKGGFEKSLKLYNAAADLLLTPSKCPPIVDLGCGVGYFAKLLFKRGYKQYTGIDFSPSMIKISKSHRLPYTFKKSSIISDSIWDLYKDYKLFTCLEVLEHINDDIKVLEGLPINSLFIFSVPNRDFHSHVRWFNTLEEVINRYNFWIDFTKTHIIETNPKKRAKIFLCKGRKKNV